MAITGKDLLEKYNKKKQESNVPTVETTSSKVTGAQLLEAYNKKKEGQTTTTESAWDKYKEFANTEEAKSGWQKYLEDAENSKQAVVEEKEDEKWWEKIGRWLGSGGAVDTSLPMGTTTQVQHSIRDTGLLEHDTPEDDWSDEQRNIFGYLYSTNNKLASEYAKYINTEFKEKQAIEKIQDSATSSFGAGAAHTAGAIATAPLGLADALNYLVLANAGVPVTRYDGTVSPFEYSQAVKSGISEHLNETGGTIDESVPIIGGKGWGDVYGVGTEFVESPYRMLFGPLANLGMGWSSRMNDALERGATEDEAFLIALTAGTAEGLLEQMGMEKLFKLGASPAKSVLIKNILKQFGAEGLEEGATSIIDNIMDNAIMQDKSNFNAMVSAYMAQGMTEDKAKQKAWMDSIEGIAYDTIVGGISGGLHAGAKTGVLSAIDNHNASKVYGNQSQNLIDDALAVQNNSELKKLAEKYQGRVEGGKNLKGSQINNLIYATDTAKLKNSILQRLGELGETSDVTAVADVLVRQAMGEELSSRDTNILNNSKAGHTVLTEINKNNIKSGGLSNNWAESIGTRKINPESYNKGAYEFAKMVSGLKEEAKKASVSKELAESGGASEANIEVSDNGKNMYYDAETDSYLDADIRSVVSTKGGIKVELGNGKTVKASDLRFATREEGVVYEMLARMDVTPDTANEIIKTFKPSDANQASLYYDSIPLAYRMGLMGNKEGLKYVKLTDAQRRILYNRGRIDAVTNTKERGSAIATSPKKATAEASKTGKNGIVYEDKFVYDEATANDLQKAGMAGAEAIAKTTNLEVHVFESFMKDGKRVAYVNGKLTSAPNGYFTAGNKIYIDINAGMNAEGAMLYALAHEVTHYIRKWNPQGFKDLADFLISEYGKHGVDITGLIARQKDKIKNRHIAEETERIKKQYEAEGKAIPSEAELEEMAKETLPSEAKLFDTAYEELVADAMSDMLADPKAYEKLAKLKQKNFKVWQKLGEVIKQVLDKLKGALNLYKKDSPVAVEAFHVRNFSAEAYNKLQDLYIKAFVEADANYDASLLSMEENTDSVAVEDTTMYSYSSLAFAAGFTPQENEDGSRAFIRDGKAVSEVTVADIENSPIGAFINYSLDKGDITDADAKRQKEMFADICTMACKTNDFSMTMQFVGSAVFTGMKANADKQYGTTYDFPSICTKTQAVIDAMSARMVKLGRGLNSDEIVKLYRDVFASGNPVPCPECYVFSRWIGIGGLLDNIKKYQDYYGEMSVSDVSKAYKKMHAEVEAFAEEQGISFGKAKGALTSKLTKEYNKLTEKIEKATNQGETVKEADRKRLKELEPMMNTVKAMTWLETVYFADSSLAKVNKNYKVPNELLFDLNNGEAFATQYPEAWAFRTTQGAGYGKAITPYAEANLGEGILVTNNTTNAIKGKAKGTLNNYFLQQKGKMDANAKKALDSARSKQKNQAFLGGQRFQSTSDARYENASDYLLAALEMQAMHGRTQVYTKVDGAVPAFANWGFSINQSLMPLGGGFDADGNIKDTSVGGMNPKVAFENRKKFETAGTITIGVNDKHIRTLIKSVNRDFVIPYHASGGKADVVAEFRTIQDREAKRNAKVRSTDYSRTQSDKILSDDVLRWLGKTDAEIEQIHKVREARIGILTSGKVDMDVVRGNRFLSELYDKFHGGEWDGVKLAKSKVESQIYPNEFWDQSVTYEESSKITRDYLEYCDDLGFLHRFSGLVPSNGKLVSVNGYDENGNRIKLTDLAYKYEDGQKTDEVEDFFWKVLTDRRMYDNNGNYLPQKYVTLNDTTSDTVTSFAKYNEGRQYDKAKSLKTAAEIAETKYSDRVLMGSLFSGGGTLEAGLVYQMLDKEFAVEFNKKIASVYTDNHGKEHMFVGDVRDFDSKAKQNVFYLHASPVCKNYSAASHSGGETTLDITTAQATARVLEEQMPQVFTVENVKRYIGSEAYNIITNKLDELGYTWDVAVYKASDYGNATKRERMIIRAVKEGQLPAKPQKASNITSWGEATRDLWKTDLIPSNLVKSKIEAIKNTPELKNLRLTKLDKPLMIYDTTKSKQINYAWADELAPTLTTKCGDARIIMPDGRVYAPTPKFMGRIQGLPDDYKYPKATTNAFKIIGNGIPTQLTKAVMGGVLDSAYEQTHDGEVLYSDRDSATALNEADITYSIREEAPPKETKRAYKLMRLVDGKLYPLFIGNNEEISVGTWYNADSPNLSQLKNLAPGTHLVNMQTGEAMTWDEYAEKHVPLKNGKPARSKPNVEDIHWANDNGYRFMHIEEKAGGKSEGTMLRKYGDTRAYYNWGVNGSSKTESGEGSASLYALRPGWHFGEVPSMHQIGYGGEDGETVRLDNQVWVEVEMSADVDYNAEAEANWSGDIPTHIPIDGYYRYATNPTQKKTKGGNTENDATKADWYVAGAFKVNRIMSDSEADSIVENYNKSTGRNVPLDYRRNYGRVFNAETMRVEDAPKYSDRDTDAVSNRTLLANALESVAKNDIEKAKLAQYKEKIALIESEQAKLNNIKAEANNLRFTKGRTAEETKKMHDLDFMATQTANRINTYDKQLLNLESTKALKNVLEREKTILRKRLEQKGKQALKAQSAKNAETVREIMTRNTESRKKAVEGRHKTEMRHRIKKLLQRLNKLLKGGKESNVKEEMKETVATALALGDILFGSEISNRDIVKLGVESVTEKESKLLNEYSDILTKKALNDERIESIRKGEIKENSFPYISELEEQNRKYDRRIAVLNKELADVFVRERARLNRIPVSTLIYQLATEYHNLKTSEVEYIRNAYNDELFNKLIDLKKDLGGVTARDMSMSQLEKVHKVFTMIEHSVRTANQEFRNGKWEDLQENASKVMEEIDRLKDTKQISSEMASKLKSYLWNELTPYYAFDKIGSETLMGYFWDLIKGQNVAARDFKEANVFASATREKYGYSKWKLDKVYDFQLNDGRTFSTTLKHLLSVYAYSKREQADLHMSIGGFFHNDKATFRKEKGILKMVRTDAVGYKVDDVVLAQIKEVLGKEKMSYVDDMLDYLTKIGEKGNEVTRVMWGVDIFTEKVYFPLKSKDDFLKKSTETATAVSLKNDGMTKETVPGASNPIVLEAFDDVWANHVEKMSTYHGLVIPIDNLNKVLHYGTWVGTDAMSVSTMLEGKFTSAATDYLEQWINDLNGGTMVKGATNPFMSFFSKFKKTVVGASLSTIVQQPTAIIRAMAEIDAKYFVGKPPLTKLNERWSEFKEYAPIAIIKEIGGFDAGGGKSASRWINSNTQTGVDKVMNTVDDISMKGAEVADMIGWLTIWEAVKRETAATTKLEVDSQEFLDKCGERATEVIVKTQVYDSTLSRSGFMRSKNDGVKMLTSFMGEPTLSINMMYSAVLNAFRGGKEAKLKAAKTIGFVYLAMILAEALSSAIYALRDDDEDESYMEKYLQSLGGSVVSDIVLAPVTSLPGVKDIVSIFQGWDVERSDMAIFKDIKDAFDGLDSDSKSPYRKVEDFAGAIAAAFGLPLKNVLRTGREVYNAGSHMLDDVSGGSAWDAFAEGITGESSTTSENLYKAILKGDASRYRKQYKTESAYETAVRNALRDNDSRIKEAAQARYEGDIAEYTRIAKQIIREGKFSQDIVVGAINAELNAIKRGETTEEVATEEIGGATSIYSASDVNSALDNGDITLAKEIISDLIETKKANGMEESNAKSSIRSSMTSYWKPLYKQAYQSGDTNEMARIRQILYASGLYGSANEVVKTTQSWLKS